MIEFMNGFALLFSVVAVLLSLHFGSQLKHRSRATFRLGYLRGRFDEKMELAPPVTEQDWQLVQDRPAPVGELLARFEKK